MAFPWTLFFDLGAIGIALLLATLIRAFIPFFQKFLIPNALTAGFILLIFYNYLAPLLGMSSNGLGALVYHLLNLAFASMTLRKATMKANTKNVYSLTVGVLSQYALQAIIGLLLTAFLIATALPKLFPSFGLFIPLGFSLGPAQAFSIGQGWESSGFTGAGSVGLTFGAVGFLWACFGGIFLVNYGIRKGWIGKEQTEGLRRKEVLSGLISRDREPAVGSRITTRAEAIDSMTLHIALVFAVYLVAYLVLTLLTNLLKHAGPQGMELAESFWNIGFMFAALTALLVRKILILLKLDYLLDNGSLGRISGTSVDFMVAGALGAISLVEIGQNWIPLLIMCLVAGIATIIVVPWIGSRLFTDHRFHRILILFGVSTGTLATGLALLRIVDPDFKTPVASDYMYSCGITFFLAIPFILAIQLPVRSYKTGNPFLFWLAVIISSAYLLFAIISYIFIAKKRSIAQPGQLWLK